MAAPPNREFDAAYQVFIRQIQDENIRLRALNLLQQQQLAVCHSKYGDECHEPWVKPEDWLKLLRKHQFTRDAEILEHIYKVACKQYNMSCICQKHGLYYVPEFDRRIRREKAVANPEKGFQDGKFFNWDGLMKYPKIVMKIINYTMVKHTAISVVVRFDRYGIYPPTEGGIDPKTGLAYRFFWGSKACAINSAPLPRDVLAPMFVCRAWHEMFGTAFYFRNKFSLESLGEFQIFCERTDPQYLERITTLMITWIGSRMVTSNPGKKGPRYCKSRHGMHQLNKFINLRHFQIRINETSKDRVRRKHENKQKRAPLLKSTKDNQNFTGNRSFRTMRGLDSVSQLRGLKCLEIFDYNRSYAKATIRDRTFLEDTRRQVYSPKSPGDQAKANLKTLPPLWRREGRDNWVMSEQVRKIVHGIFDMLSDDAEDDSLSNAGDNLDDDNDGGGDDNQHPGDGPGNDNDNGDDQSGNNNHNVDDSSDSESEDDDASDQGVNAPRAAPAASRAREFAHGGGGNEFDEDEGGLPIKTEDDVQFICSVKRPSRTIDLTNLPDLEGPDTAFPSIEKDQAKKEIKDEDEADAGDVMANIPIFQDRPRAQRESSPFGNLSLGRARTGQSSLFVRQSPASRRSFSGLVGGFFGPPRYRKRSVEEDDEKEGVSPRPSLRRRLSSMAIDEDEMEVDE